MACVFPFFFHFLLYISTEQAKPAANVIKEKKNLQKEDIFSWRLRMI